MPYDTKDIFGDNLYVSDQDGEGERLPFGSGRKSQFALGRTVNSDKAPADDQKPEPKKRSQPAAKSGRTKKKNSAAGQVKKKKKKKITSGGTVSGSKKLPADKPKALARNAASKTKAKSAGVAEPKKKRLAANGATKKTAAKKKTARKTSKRNRLTKEELLSYVYLGAMAAGGAAKKVFGTRRNRIIAASLLAVMLLFCCAMGVRSMYTSKTMFADEGKTLDETAIEDRLITDEQNKDKVTYFLIVGVDKSQSLTDCIWIMCFDNAAHKMNVLQIPRDTYVGEDSRALGKINGVYKTPKTVDWCEACGKQVFDDEIQSGSHTVCGSEVTQKTESNINAVIRVIKERLSLPIDHYVLFDFEGFEKVIDAMGGVDILLEEEMKVWPNKKTYITLPAGVNHLDGATALKFMRTRKNYANGDLGRVAGQRKLVKALFEKVGQLSSFETLNILKAAYGNFKTDMSLEEIRSFIAPVKKCGADSLHMFELPGEDHWVKPHPSYYICDEAKTAEMINEYMLPYSNKITAYNISFPDLGY